MIPPFYKGGKITCLYIGLKNNINLIILKIQLSIYVFPGLTDSYIFGKLTFVLHEDKKLTKA